VEPRKKDPLSSRALLDRIGLGDPQTAPLLLDDDPLDSPLDTLAQALVERYQSLEARHTFRPGDLVTWKPGLRNRRYPRDGKPAVVLEVLAAPLLDSDTETGSTYYREPLDLVLGLFLNEGEHRGDFLSWHFDGRRFQPWSQGGRARSGAPL